MDKLVTSSSFLITKGNFLNQLLGLFQEVATRNANLLGFGPINLDPAFMWVIARYYLVFDKPFTGTQLQIDTWSRGARKFIAQRDFQFHTEFSTERGYAITYWVLLRKDNHEIANVQQVLKMLPIDQLALSIPPLTSANPFTEQKEIVVSEQYIDFNHHVNNAAYLSWVLDFLPPLKNHYIKTINLEFKKETFLNDQLLIQRDYREKSSTLHYRLTNLADQQTVFVADVGLVDRLT